MKIRALMLLLLIPPLAFAGRPSKNWSLYSSVETRSSLETFDQARNVLEMSLELMPAYKFQNNSKVRAYLAASKELQGSREQSLSNAFIGHTQKLFNMNSDTSVSSDIRGYIPLNEDSIKDESLKTRIYLGLSTNSNLAIPYIESSSLTLKISGYRNIHEFETSRSGSVNTQYSLSEYLGLNLQLTKDLSFSTYVTNSQYFSYYNNRKPDVFEAGQSISYAITQDIEMSLGHTLGGKTFKDDGVTNNIEFFNSKESTIYTSLSINF